MARLGSWLLMGRLIRRRILVVGFALGSWCAASSAAADEEPVKGSGAIGGALLATEAVVVSEALAGVEPAWVYWLSAFASATVGGYVGSRIEASTKPEVSSAMLGAGLVLAIPSVVWLGNLRDADTTRPRARAAPRSFARRWLAAEPSHETAGDGVAPRFAVRVGLLSGCF